MHKTLCQLLVLVSTLASLPSLAEDEPFALAGLHTNLTMTEALARAEALGGACMPTPPRRKIGGLSARCTFPACGSNKDAATCTPEQLDAATFKVGGQPVHTMDIEAPAEDARLRNLSLFYSGEVDAVAYHLLELFGEPKFDTAPQLEKSWTRSRRLIWQRGVQRISFMTRPQTILLAADRVEYESQK